MARRIIFKPDQHKSFLAHTETELTAALKRANETTGDERQAALNDLSGLMEQKRALLHNISIDAQPVKARLKKAASGGKAAGPARVRKPARTPANKPAVASASVAPGGESSGE